MSLVELALKKMHEATRGGTSAAAPAPAPAKRPVPVAAEAAPKPSSHRRIDTPENEQPAGPVVQIDQNALRAAGLIPPEHQRRSIADQFRHIKRPLVAAAIGRGAQKLDRGQLIMTASAMPGEGKTFTSINLALSMANEKDVSILLVDADVAKPHISRTLGVGDRPGLIDVLRDESLNVESLILPTSVPNLSVLPAGQHTETAAELLASHRMEQTMSYLAESNGGRLVLIDSPPLLLTNESRALAHWVGQVVLVVRAELTPHQAVLDAIEHLGVDKSVNLVLNQSKVAETPYYYGYGDQAKTETG